MRKLFLCCLFALLLSGISVQKAVASCPTWHVLTNGTTADANQVMDNFNNVLGCPNFTGNVGIGTGIPGAALDIETSALAGVIIGNYNGSPAGPTPTTGGNALALYSPSNSGLFLAPIDSSHSIQPTYGTQFIAAYTTGNLFSIKTGGYDVLTVNETSGATTMFGPPGTSGLVVLPNGNVGIGTASPSYLLTVNGTAYATGAAGALSDRRHKTDIQPLNVNAIDLVRQLRPVTFRWKQPKDAGMKGLQTGFIAQDVQKVLPNTVLTAPDKSKTLGLKYNEFIPLLVKAVQEQQQRIDDLDRRNRELSNRLSLLTRKLAASGENRMRTAAN